MIRARGSLAAALALVLLSTGAARAERAPAPTALDRLGDAAEAHPDDPDLAWAYAKRLAIEGDVGQAIDRTRSFTARWPDRQPDARVQIARALIDRDADSAAGELLDEAVEQTPGSGEAHFYRGIVQRREGRLGEADRSFRIAGQLEPKLRPETLLARALGLFEQGRDEEAVGLLHEILEIDPTGDSAIRARLLLRRRELLDFEGRYAVDAYVGFDYDDNVTLESGTEEVLPSGQEDWRGVWGAGGSWREPLGSQGSLVLGLRYDQTRHVDLHEYDLLATTGFVSGTWRASERLALRLDGIAYNTLQDLEQEVVGGLVRPNVIVSFGPVWGALRAFGHAELAEYDDSAPLAPWERDAWTAGAGLEYFLPLPAAESWITASGSWLRTLTQAEPGGGSDGFDGDFDYDSWRARAYARLALPWALRAEIDAAYTYDRYHNDNFSYALQTLGGTRQREDDIVSGRVGLSREIVRHVRLEAYWQGTRRISNVDVFDYDKQQGGILLRISTN